MSNKNTQAANSAELQEVLDDLSMRFLVNLPAEEYESFERLFFAIEAAHWFYDDFYRERNPTLPRLPLKQFAAKLFDHIALLQQYRNQVEKLTAQFQSYKQVVMTCGAALLNPSMDRVVLVRGWGQTARWGFPKGKLAKDETELAAAVREVMEETGFDMSPYVTEDQFYVDSFTSGRHCRIYFVPGIPENVDFETMTRKEISDIRWVPISVLPDSPKSAKSQNKSVMGKRDRSSPSGEKKMLFAQNGVAPFTKRLRAWIKRQRKQQNRNMLSPPELPTVTTPEDMESTLLSCAPEPETQAAGFDASQMLSVEELEANLKSAPIEAPSSSRRRGGRSKGKGSSEVTSKGNGRKSRKEIETFEAKRNQATFGIDAGTTMNDSERDRLFRRYVVETDRIAAARGLQDDFWPVPYVTSKDFSAQDVKEAEDEHRNSTKPPPVVSENGFETVSFTSSDQTEPSAGRKGARVLDLPRPQHKTFVFDRRAIMACLTTSNPS